MRPRPHAPIPMRSAMPRSPNARPPSSRRGKRLPKSSVRDDAFARLIDKPGAGASWVVLPDIVAGGARSLEKSLRWSNRWLSACPMVPGAVQDGMQESDLAHVVGRNVGLFLGGSTEWKLGIMATWGKFCQRHGIYYIVAGVNTERRVWMAVAAGADSIDGSSASRFVVPLPMLDRAVRQADLFAA
jgi:hypothetical protein